MDLMINLALNLNIQSRPEVSYNNWHMSIINNPLKLFSNYRTQVYDYNCRRNNEKIPLSSQNKSPLYKIVITLRSHLRTRNWIRSGPSHVCHGGFLLPATELEPINLYWIFSCSQRTAEMRWGWSGCKNHVDLALELPSAGGECHPRMFPWDPNIIGPYKLIQFWKIVDSNQNQE